MTFGTDGTEDTGSRGTGVPLEHIRIARVVGETDDGLTLFVPKDMEGLFHLDGGERFLTLIFVHQPAEVSVPAMETWLPWEDSDV